MKAFDVVALGELLIDFTENGESAQGNPILEANPGGAPCNVLAMLNRLGKKTAFIGKVGNDTFGRQLAEVVQQGGTDTTNLILDDSVHTTLAFVHTFPDGEREFSFYRNPGADMMLKQEEVMPEVIAAGKIFHFGTLSSTHEGVRAATRYAIGLAKENGLLISFDPNLREPLWQSLEDARREIAYGLSQCDILKISDNELEFMTGTSDYTKGVAMLWEQYPNIQILFVTLGKDGSRAYYKDKMVEKKPFLGVKTIEKTGAGDTFEGCALYYLLEHGLEHLTEENLAELLVFANAGASLITTRKGALKVMPEKSEIEALIRSASEE
jgi:fructokinase